MSNNTPRSRASSTTLLTVPWAVAEAVAADMVVDAENLLNDHDPALGRTGRVGAIGAQLVAVAGGEREVLTQVFLL